MVVLRLLLLDFGVLRCSPTSSSISSPSLLCLSYLMKASKVVLSSSSSCSDASADVTDLEEETFLVEGFFFVETGAALLLILLAAEGVERIAVKSSSSSISWKGLANLRVDLLGDFGGEAERVFTLVSGTSNDGGFSNDSVNSFFKAVNDFLGSLRGDFKGDDFEGDDFVGDDFVGDESRFEGDCFYRRDF